MNALLRLIGDGLPKPYYIRPFPSAAPAALSYVPIVELIVIFDGIAFYTHSVCQIHPCNSISLLLPAALFDRHEPLPYKL